MSDMNNSLQIDSSPQLRATIAPSQQIAVGMQLSRLQLVAQIQGDEQAPHFSPEQEPNQDGRSYQATNGQVFYRPEIRLAQRKTAPIAPDIRFLKDSLGKVRLQFELEESPLSGLPANAEPFNTRVTQITLRWMEAGQQRQRLFDQPTLISTDVPGDVSKSNFAIRVGAELTPEDVQPLYLALSKPESQAALSVQLSFGYWVDRPMPGETPPTHLPPLRSPGRLIFVNPAAMQLNSGVSPSVRAVGFTPVNPNMAVDASTLRSLNRVQSAQLWRQGAVDAVLDQAKQRELQPNFQTLTLTRTLAFTFDPSLQQHRLIYSAIRGEDSLSTSWIDTEFGPIRKASFPNTVYRLPDEIRLAYNAELGAPHMIPTLYRDEKGDVRVRVVFRAIAWHDPDKLVRLRDYLYRSSAGALAAPQVIVGGYKEAKLRFTNAFPEQIHTLNSDDMTIALEGATDLTLDLSQEFYKFICNLMVGPLGLTGEVSVKLDVAAAEGEAPTERVRRISMRLNLDDLASLPITVKLESDSISPKQVQLINQSGAEMRLGGCVPRLLQYDANSAAPIAVFAATSTTVFPVNLVANSTVVIDLKPNDSDQALFWNAVHLEVISESLTQTPVQVLDRIHELSPKGSLDWNLAIECPPFQRDPLPEKFKDLHSVEVQISRPGFSVQQVVLRKGLAATQVVMQRTLKDFISPEAEGIGTFEYRVRNIYFDRNGNWSATKPGEGSNLSIFPNPIEGD